MGRRKEGTGDFCIWFSYRIEGRMKKKKKEAILGSEGLRGQRGRERNRK